MHTRGGGNTDSLFPAYQTCLLHKNGNRIDIDQVLSKSALSIRPDLPIIIVSGSIYYVDLLSCSCRATNQQSNSDFIL